MEYQCCICKHGITSEDKRINKHNPCALTVTTNCDHTAMERKEQTFYCHYDCFKQLHGDDSTLYLEDIATPQEAIEENQRLRNQVEEVAQVLYDAGEETDLWEALFQKPSGTWNLVSDVFQGSFDEIKLKIVDAQNELFDPLLIMWTDDFSRHRRSTNRRWRVVFLATESYEFPVPLLIGTPVDELE